MKSSQTVNTLHLLISTKIFRGKTHEKIWLNIKHFYDTKNHFKFVSFSSSHTLSNYTPSQDFAGFFLTFSLFKDLERLREDQEVRMNATS